MFNLMDQGFVIGQGAADTMRYEPRVSEKVAGGNISSVDGMKRGMSGFAKILGLGK